MTKTITQQTMIRATPAEVYAALMDSDKHSAFTGEPARIEARAGGAFTCYDAYIKGVTLELVPDKLIVQAWRSRNWPKGTYSIVTFKLLKQAGGRTQLCFSQIGVPVSDYKEKSGGWKTHYWERLKKYLEK